VLTNNFLPVDLPGFSADGRYIACGSAVPGSQDKQSRLMFWDAYTGHQSRVSECGVSGGVVIGVVGMWYSAV
jgi:hypothetical protein